MGEDFTITAMDPDRVVTFEKIFGKKTVRIAAPIPKETRIIEGETVDLYEVDPVELTDEVKERWIREASRNFGGSLQEVKDILEASGFALQSNGCTVAIANPQRWV